MSALLYRRELGVLSVSCAECRWTCAGADDRVHEAAGAHKVEHLRREWLEAHPGYSRPPCGGCSAEGTVPEQIPETGRYVWRCEACAARDRVHERRREDAEPEFEGHAHARLIGGHVHTRVFVGRKGRTRGRAGVLITTEGPETDWLLLALECGGLEVTRETADEREA